MQLYLAFKRYFCAFFILFLAFASVASAQTGTTSIHGTITDKTGGVVTGAVVKLSNPALSVERTTTSAETGLYNFVALQPGSYVLTVEAPGFRKYERKNVELLVNNPTTLNVDLQVGTTSETVEVSAPAETLNTTDASVGVAFDENQVKQLPLESRNVPDLLSLQAGVVYTGNRPDIDQDRDTRSGAVNGARSDQSNVTLDGISVNPKNGYAFQSVLPVTPDSVEEFRVTTSNANADQGVAGGAQVALVTKSGTNQFHGSAYEYNRNSYFSANDYFLKASDLANGTPNKPQFLNRNIFGGSLGGPIKKDRLFIFANYEGYRDVEQVSALRTVPSAALRDGVVEYVCGTPSACPGNTVTGLSGASYSVGAGNFALSPAQLTAMDPVGTLPGYTGPVGPDPAVVSFFNKMYPLPNDTSVGDGLNTLGYRFAASTRNTKNWYIAKIDYNITRDGKQRLSLSGGLANQNQANAPFLPGQAPITDIVNYNKGLVASYSAVISPSLINNFHYGFIRQSLGTIGNTNLPWNTFRGLDPVLGTGGSTLQYSSTFQRPINSFYDDVSYLHGKHSWQFGFQISRIRNPNTSTTSSFSSAYTNSQWLNTSGLAGRTASPLNPANNGYPDVDFANFGTSYDNAVTALFGMAVEVNAQYNFQRNGNPLPQGAPVIRNFAENGYEMYAQDTWKVKPNLTLTLGLRYSLFSPPWETNGLQVAPTENLGTWFGQRGQGMNNGQPSINAPPVVFDWAGPANGKPGYYNWDYHDFGPRVAVAWSPGYDSGLLKNLFGGAGRSSVRAGFGIVYDRLGEGLLDTFDQSGSFGLTSSIPNAAASQTVLSTPRITNMNTIPLVDNLGNPIFVPAPPPPPSPFPTNPAPGSEAITWGLDSSVKSPFSYTIDLSVQRQLSSSFTLDVAYVGRLSHRLLSQSDLAMPLNPFDKKAGIDYFTAATALAKLYRNGMTTNQFNSSMVPANVRQYWQDITQAAGPGGAYAIGALSPYGTCASNGLNSTSDPTVLAFDLLCANSLNESLSIYEMDTGGVPNANNPNAPSYFYSIGNYTGPNVFYSPQYSSLYGLRTLTNANYNAMEITLQHKMTHGVQFDFNYTYAKSIDISSDAERVGAWGGLNGQIVNAWSPASNRGPSDFDLRHQLNSNWIWLLPFGRGQAWGHDINRAVDAFIGGWQLSGLFRLTSGFPVNVDNGGQYPTNYQLEGNANKLGPVSTGVYFTGPGSGPNGTSNNTAPNVFANGPAAINSFGYTFPGQTGARNQIRGPGFFGIDLGLAKRWKMPWSEGQSLQFRWEVFNVTNSVRFDVQSAAATNPAGTLYNGNGQTFGNYTGLITNPRIMQFALRYEF